MCRHTLNIQYQFTGPYLPQTPQKKHVYAFKPTPKKYKNLHIIETAALIPAKFCTRKKSAKYSSHVVQKLVQEIQDGGQQSYWKINKLPHLRNGLTNRFTIWHDDTDWLPECSRPLIFHMLSPRWRTATILNIMKNCHDSNIWLIAMKFGMLTHIAHLNCTGCCNFEFLEIQDGRNIIWLSFILNSFRYRRRNWCGGD